MQETGEAELSLSVAGPFSRLTEAERETLLTTGSRKEMFGIAQDAGIFPKEAGRSITE